ncbi:MAG: histidine ammonia-lyase [Bacteroidia bacterium]|nr:histidine ammonia-lyase [Bacteroidia bacterium]MCF8446705.1 histidine ammonia-lyase [Bacteroidia bacterium]
MENYFEIVNELSYQDIESIIRYDRKLKLSDDTKIRIANCRNYLDKKMAKGGDPIYGINTGFGSLCNTVISNDELSTLQENLLLSHACGAGELVDIDIIRLMLLLKIQSLSFGHSGVAVETVNRLIDFFNEEIYPVVYDQGSLGASGDLAPLAHLSLPLIGEGEVWVATEGGFERKSSKEILEKMGWKALTLQSKEGLALINGTQFMASYGLYVWIKTEHIINWSTFIAATSLDAFDGRIEPFHPALHQLRPHGGQVVISKMIRHFLKDSQIAMAPKKQVQDPYSFRCIPQVLGASHDAFTYFKMVMLMEINSVTDNPNIFPEMDTIISGGNFHGQPLALAFDFLAIALAEIGNISERRTFQLISGQRNLPAFLTEKPGLNSGFMIPQYTAASIVSQNKQLCTPASVDSIVSSNGQEDHVSMGANAATKLLRVCQNVETIIAIEYMNAAQALEFRRPLKSSNTVEEILEKYRAIVPRLENDRYLYEDIQKTISFIGEIELPTLIDTLEELNN